MKFIVRLTIKMQRISFRRNIKSSLKTKSNKYQDTKATKTIVLSEKAKQKPEDTANIDMGCSCNFIHCLLSRSLSSIMKITNEK